MLESCPHLDEADENHIKPVKPSSKGCKECLESGDSWVHLRLCLTCGHVGCCDSSPNKHASHHFRTSKHPVIRSFEPGEDWAYCYEDDLMIDQIKTFPGEAPAKHYSAP